MVPRKPEIDLMSGKSRDELSGSNIQYRYTRWAGKLIPEIGMAHITSLIIRVFSAGVAKGGRK